ncbi:FUSC family protein [Streptomyces sp. RTd22]|uniref:FUSC family protein n=1 Tax=Streptomyces sp. RTd22 TaxID=1841249 RepID=UPI0007C458E4|nr:FUSC family protein [Streptomyces sp. RTd22]
MTWPRSLMDTVRSGLTIERARLEPLAALRAAAGVAIVIGLSLWTASPSYAASAAFGAFSAGTSTFQRSWRPRKVIALVAGAGLGLSTFVGYLAMSHLALFLLLLAVWAFLAGMAWAAGPTAGIVATTTVAMMLLTITLPTGALEALEHAAVIAFGGVAQAVLIFLFPIRRWGRHRDALADALAAVADYARRLREDPVAPFAPEPMITARSAAAVTPSQARRRPAALHGPRGLAERIRPALAALADPRVGAPAEGPGRDRARELLDAAADVLDAAARSIRRGAPAEVPSATRETLRIDDGDGAEETDQDGADETLEGPARRAAVQLSHLLTEVLEIADSSGRGLGPTPGADEAPPLLRPTVFQLVPIVLRAMRRELRGDSPVLRHALRLAAVACLGYVLGSALPLGHGYWAPVTSVMVMRPDFHRTYSRAVARFAGTLVGVALATGAVQLTHPDAYLSGGLAVIAAALTYLLMRTGYAASQCTSAAYAVLLLGMGGEGWHQTVPDRVLLTLLGGVLAMLAYVAFPAWETPRMLDRLADWLAASGRYAAAVVRGYAEPGELPATDVRRTLLADRTAHAAWNEALDRAKREPVRHRGLTRAQAEEAQAALEAFGQAAMLLETHLPQRGARPVPGAARFADALAADTERAARQVRERRRPRWDRTKEALVDWEADSTAEAVVQSGAELLVRSLDQLTTAMDRAPLERDTEAARQQRP